MTCNTHTVPAPLRAVSPIEALCIMGIPQAARKGLHFRSPRTSQELTFLWLSKSDSSSIYADPTYNNHLKEAGNHYDVTLLGFAYCFLNCFSDKSHAVP